VTVRVHTEVFCLAARSIGYLHTAGHKNGIHMISRTVTFASSPTVQNVAFGFAVKHSSKLIFSPVCNENITGNKL
jgi:hypothetical protein